MKMKLSKPHKGFTLIETLFAILIFSTALVSLMTIAGKGISATNTAREQVVAHYLAQEGLEVARNVRDTNFLATTAWDAGFSSCTTTVPCKVVYGSGLQTPTLAALGTPCNGVQAGSGCIVGTSNNSFVDFNGSNPSAYTRIVTAVPVTPTPPQTDPDEYMVSSTVRWTSKTIGRMVTLKTLVKKWQ